MRDALFSYYFRCVVCFPGADPGGGFGGQDPHALLGMLKLYKEGKKRRACAHECNVF